MEYNEMIPILLQVCWVWVSYLANRTALAAPQYKELLPMLSFSFCAPRQTPDAFEDCKNNQ